MGILSSSVSFTLYGIKEKIEDKIWQDLSEKLREHSFQEIEGGIEEKSFGWVSFDNWLDNSFLHSPLIGNYAVFALRLDVRRIPSSVFKKYYELALSQALEQKQAQGRKFLAKEEKKEIKEQVKLRLLSKILPVPTVVDVVWDVDKQRVFFGATSNKLKELFVELFFQTFHLELTYLTPVELGLINAQLKESNLQNYTPSVFI